MPNAEKIIVTDEMVNRFLSWTLLGDFYPDGGIHFTAPNSGNMPTGTNLFHVGQVRAMLEHTLQPKASSAFDALPEFLPPPAKPVIHQYFAYGHLPAFLQDASKPIGDLADKLEATIPDGPEKDAGMRKLLEAKDCFVRAALTK